MGKIVNKSIRLTEEEAYEIESFLNENPLFDFSTVARMALRDFIRRPIVRVKPLLKGGRIKNIRRKNEQRSKHV